MFYFVDFWDYDETYLNFETERVFERLKIFNHLEDSCFLGS